MRRRITYTLPVAAVAVLAALALVTTAESGSQGERKRAMTVAQASLKSTDGKGAGSVRLVERRIGKVEVVIRARGLQPGLHGFHTHEKGVCEPPSFTSAGGHSKRDDQTHGGHAGDMPPLLATGDGKARATFVTDFFRIRDLLAGDGSAIVIHAGRDNLANIPSRYASGTTTGPDEETLKTGDSGSRFACGVLRRKRR